MSEEFVAEIRIGIKRNGTVSVSSTCADGVVAPAVIKLGMLDVARSVITAMLKPGEAPEPAATKEKL